MAFLEYSLIYILSFFFILMAFFIVLIHRPQNRRSLIPTNWPVIGMIPAVLVNTHQLHDYATQLIIHSGGTFKMKGPWFISLDILVTTNPLDIHHILSKNFSNYPKGDKFFKIFDVLGDGIFNSDGKLWEINRKVTMSLLMHEGFQSLLQTIIWNKVENGLLPVLESCCANGTEMDLQDIFHRFAFDTICNLLFDNDPQSLSLDFPYIPCLKAFTDAEEALLFRHVTPPCLWKLQQLLRVGNEQKLSDARKTIDQFIYKYLDQSQNEYENMKCEHQEGKFIFFTALMRGLKDHDQIVPSWNTKKFHRDFLLNLMAAGKDTTSSALSWFFYNLARNPTVEDKILQEIHKHLGEKLGERWNSKEMGKMIYLHGALCESLRLFPPVPFNHKSPLQPDILPSGHQVDHNTKIVLSFYSMGRMKSIWGEDCMEFKPERWVSKSGGIKHEPSYKFTSFNAGPRTCVGKDMSFSQLKIVSAAIIYHYHIELVEGHPVLPADSMVLQLKHGLKVRLTKRSERK